MKASKLIRQSIFTVFLLLLVLPVYAAVTAGIVLSINGTIKAEGADHSIRVLTNGAEFYVGDTLFTLDNSKASLKFIDNALMTLRANTRYKIIAYWLDEKNPTNSSSITELLKGGLRTITGKIGKINRQGFAIKTPIASIGIRGTDLGLQFVGEALEIAFNKGAGYVKTDKFTLHLGEGNESQFAIVYPDGKIVRQKQRPESMKGSEVPVDAVLVAPTRKFLVDFSPGSDPISPN